MVTINVIYVTLQMEMMVYIKIVHLVEKNVVVIVKVVRVRNMKNVIVYIAIVVQNVIQLINQKIMCVKFVIRVIVKNVRARRDHHRTVLGRLQERQVIACIIAIPQIALTREKTECVR